MKRTRHKNYYFVYYIIIYMYFKYAVGSTFFDIKPAYDFYKNDLNAIVCMYIINIKMRI